MYFMEKSNPLSFKYIINNTFLYITESFMTFQTLVVPNLANPDSINYRRPGYAEPTW